MISISDKTNPSISNKVLIPSALVATNSEISLVGSKDVKLHYQPVARDMVEITLPSKINFKEIPVVSFKISKRSEQ